VGVPGELRPAGNFGDVIVSRPPLRRLTLTSGSGAAGTFPIFNLTRRAHVTCVNPLGEIEMSTAIRLCASREPNLIQIKRSWSPAVGWGAVAAGDLDGFGNGGRVRSRPSVGRPAFNAGSRRSALSNF
jgi:hypothetical protein